MLTYGGMALHNPREHLLGCVDADILGKMLLLSRASQQVGVQGMHGEGLMDAPAPASGGVA